MFYPYEDAGQVLRAWRDLAPRLPETVSPQFVLWNIPPEPEIPAELHGAKVVIVAGLYAGAPGDATAALAPLAGLGTPLMDVSATVNYLDAQSALDPAFPAGGRYFFKSHFLDELTDHAIEAMLACDARRPNPESLMVIRTLGGAIARVRRPRQRLPTPRRAVQPQHRRRLVRPGAGRRRHRLGARRRGTRWRRSPPAGCTSTSPDSATKPTARRCSARPPSTSHRIQTAYDPDGIFAAAADRP